MTPISTALAKLPVTVLSGFLGAGKTEVESS
jgi:tRNA A37 threonylcarbamoyladenosine biosynthesis protein TsaE